MTSYPGYTDRPDHPSAPRGERLLGSEYEAVRHQSPTSFSGCAHISTGQMVRREGEGVIAMRFLMLVCRDSVPVQAPAGRAGQAVEQWVTAMDDRRVRVAGGELAPEAEAVAVRVRGGQRQSPTARSWKPRAHC